MSDTTDLPPRLLAIVEAHRANRIAEVQAELDCLRSDSVYAYAFKHPIFLDGEDGAINLPKDADWPLRKAVRESFLKVTGKVPDFTISRWGDELSQDERKLVTTVATLPDMDTTVWNPIDHRVGAFGEVNIAQVTAIVTASDDMHIDERHVFLAFLLPDGNWQPVSPMERSHMHSKVIAWALHDWKPMSEYKGELCWLKVRRGDLVFYERLYHVDLSWFLLGATDWAPILSPYDGQVSISRFKKTPSCAAEASRT